MNFIGFSFLLIGFFLFPKVKQMEKSKEYEYPPSFKNYFSLAKSISKK